MSREELIKTNQRIIEILSQDRGYFGRVNTWGQRPTQYEFIGYELDIDFLSTLENMSMNQRKNLVSIINYFEIHAGPLKRMIENDKRETLIDFYSDWAWSHFMTVVMFGMLEVAVKITTSVKYKNEKKKYIDKYESIKLFLETYLPEDRRKDIAKRYKTEDGGEVGSFSEVIEHLWKEIRSGFIHEAGVYYKGSEWTTIKGIGTKENPMTFEADVPMQELLQITWQAILNSYGYRGILMLPKYKK